MPGAVGKSSLLITYTTSAFPEDYVPTVFDNYSSNLLHKGKPVSLHIFDTGGQEDYDRLRPLSYPQTDVFLLCFSVASKASFENVLAKWRTELKQHAPGVPIILVGTKADLRSTCATMTQDSLVPKEDAKKLARQIGAAGFIETSALKHEGLNEAFSLAIESVSTTRRHPVKAKKSVGVLSLARSSRPSAARPVPPLMPPAGMAPRIEVATCTFGDDLRRLVACADHADVELRVGGTVVPAHRLILCAASQFWHGQLMGEAAPLSKSPLMMSRWKEEQSETAVSSKQLRQIVELDPSIITVECLHLLLEYHYTGMPSLLLSHPLLLASPAAREQLTELREAAALFGDCEPLLRAIENATLGKSESLNASIGTYVNDATGKRLVDLFLGKDLFSDVTIVVDNRTTLPGHLALLRARCPSIAAMLVSAGRDQVMNVGETKPMLHLVQGAHDAITLAKGVAATTTSSAGEGAGEARSSQVDAALSPSWRAALELIYSGHATLDRFGSVQEFDVDADANHFGNDNSVLARAEHLTSALSLATQLQLPRLLTLCELAISKLVDIAVAAKIACSPISVVELLLTARRAGAAQLTSFLLHFCASNYDTYDGKWRRTAIHSKAGELRRLDRADREHIEAHRWPPQSFHLAVAAYERALQDSRRGALVKSICRALGCGGQSATVLQQQANVAKQAEAARTAQLVAATRKEERAREAQRAKAAADVAVAQMEAAAAIARRAATPTQAQKAVGTPRTDLRAAPVKGELIIVPEIDANGNALTGATSDKVALIDDAVANVSARGFAVGVPVLSAAPPASEFVVCCIDRSCSMSAPLGDRSRMEAVKQMFMAFRDRTDSLEDGVMHHIGLLQFDSRVDTLQEPSADLSAFEGKLDHLQVGGETAIYSAIVSAVKMLTPIFNGDPSHRDDLRIIVLTDGQSNTGVDPQQSLDAAASVGAIVDCILVGNAPDSNLRRIVSATGGECYSLLSIAEGFELLEAESVVSMHARRGCAPKPPYEPHAPGSIKLGGLSEKAFTRGSQVASQQAPHALVSALQTTKVVPVERLPQVSQLTTMTSTGTVADTPSTPGLNGLSASAARRVLHELKQIAHADPSAWLQGGQGVHIFPAESNLTLWRALIEGPADSPFSGGTFALIVQLPHDYPNRPPSIRFETPIYHCNVSEAGAICLDWLREKWGSHLTVSKCLEAIRLLLGAPNPDDALRQWLAELTIAHLNSHGKDKRYVEQAAAQTQQHACKSVDEWRAEMGC